MPTPRRQPIGKPMDYKTYTLRPRFRRATCIEVNCKHYREGWTFPLDLLKADPQLLYLAKHSGKRYTERVENGKTYLVYAPGQPCFESVSHKLPIDERPFMFAGRGDFRTFDRRGLPRDAREHTRIDDWVDDFANHQQKIAREIEKG